MGAYDSCFVCELFFAFFRVLDLGKIDTKARRAALTLAESGKNSTKSGSIITILEPFAYFRAYLLGRRIEKSYSFRISGSFVLMGSLFIFLSLAFCRRTGANDTDSVAVFGENDHHYPKTL